MSLPTDSAARPWGETLTRRRVALVLTSVVLSMLLGALDQTVVGTAMPRVIADLNGLQHYAWVTTAYMLSSTVSMPIWGKLSDTIGRRRFFLLGMSLFVVGSALCGFSRSMGQLIAFRALQGLGNGAMVPTDLALIGDIFPPAERAKWSSVLMSIFGLSTLVGPPLGGWITDSIGWRWTFYVNVPVGFIAFTFAAFAIPARTTRRRQEIDWRGALLLALAAVSLLLGFSWAGTQYAWSSPVIIGLLALSTAAWVVFLISELRVTAPVLNPRLFRNSVFSVSTAASMVQSGVMFSTTTFLPLFVQGVQGRTATSSGTILMPMMLSSMVSGLVTGQILSRTGRYRWTVLASFATMSVGTFLLSRLSLGTSGMTLAGSMVILGLGLGISISAFTPIVQNQYPSHRLGEVTGGLSFFRSIGGTISLAVFGTMLSSRFASSLAANMPAELKGLASDPIMAHRLSDPQVLLSAGARADLLQAFSRLGGDSQRLLDLFTVAVRRSLEDAILSIFLVTTILSVVGFVIVLFLKETQLRRGYVEASEEP